MFEMLKESAKKLNDDFVRITFTKSQSELILKELEQAEAVIKELEDSGNRLQSLNDRLAENVAELKMENIDLKSKSIDKFEEWVKIDQSCSLCKLHDDCNNFGECMIKHTIRVLNYYKEHVAKVDQ